MWATREKVGDSLFEEYVAFLAQQYSRFKSEPLTNNEESCYLSLWTDAFDYDAIVRKAQYPDAYAEILEKSLAIDGKPADYLQSEEFQASLD